MKYYSKEFRFFLTGLLTGYRKMIEQSLATSKDPNYHLFANDVKKQIDEALKIAKPTMYNAVEGKIKKLEADTEAYMKRLKDQYDSQVEELKKALEEQLEARLNEAKAEQEEKIRSELTEQFENEKKTMLSVSLLPEVLQAFLDERGYVSAVSDDLNNESEDTDENKYDDGIDDMPLEDVDKIG